MKDTMSISINQPCDQEWSGFSVTQYGRHCSVCDREVIDFSAKSDEDIIEFFKNGRNSNCGRFREAQLKQYNVSGTSSFLKPGWTLFKVSVICLLILFMSQQSKAQNQSENQTITVPGYSDRLPRTTSTNKVGGIITGVVKDETGEPIPGVNIYLEGGKSGTISDIEGNFEFPTELESGQVLVFSFIGLEKVEYTVTNNYNSKIEIRMHADLGCMMVGAVSSTTVYTEKRNVFSRIGYGLKSLFK